MPQATLGGKLKGNSVQYHGNMGQEEGQRLYHLFCIQVLLLLLLLILHLLQLKQELGEERVREGQYGARQVLSMVTNGPYSHTFDIL